MSRGKICGVSWALGIVLFVGMILFACSFQTLNPGEMGLAQNTISRQIQDKVYFEGRHFLFVGHKFLKYPLRWQLIDFSNDDSDADGVLTAVTASGESVSLEIAVYYTLVPSEAHELYSTLGLNFHTRMLNEAKNVLKNAASEFRMEDYYTDRERIQKVFFEKTFAQLRPLHGRVQKVLLRGVQFTATTEASIISKMQSAQNNIRLEYQKEVDTARAENKVIITRAESYIVAITSNAAAQGSLIVEEAAAEANELYIQAETEAWANYKTKLGLTNEQLLKAQYARSILRGTPSDSLLVGYEQLKASVQI